MCGIFEQNLPCAHCKHGSRSSTQTKFGYYYYGHVYFAYRRHLAKMKGERQSNKPATCSIQTGLAATNWRQHAACAAVKGC
jgi:hypothetical protein